jgi:hypothetical protein
MRRHETAVRFRQQFGDRAWTLLQELREREFARYLRAIASIDRGRSRDVASALERWAAEQGIS